MKRSRPELVIGLIARRARLVICNELSFRFRYLLGFLLFAFILWIIGVVITRIIDTRYWDALRSDQFRYLDELKKHNRH
jgi:hypothetical protein